MEIENGMIAAAEKEPYFHDVLYSLSDFDEKVALVTTHPGDLTKEGQAECLFGLFFEFLTSEERVRTVGIAFKERFGEYVLCLESTFCSRRFTTLIDVLEDPEFTEAYEDYPRHIDVVGILLDVGLKRASSGNTWALANLYRDDGEIIDDLIKDHQEFAPRAREQQAIVDRAKAQYNAEVRAADMRYRATLEAAVASAQEKQDKAVRDALTDSQRRIWVLEEAAEAQQTAIEDAVKVALAEAEARHQAALADAIAANQAIQAALTKTTRRLTKAVAKAKAAVQRAEDAEKRAREAEAKAWETDSEGAADDDDEDVECCVCMEADADARLVPCGHDQMCMNCAKQVNECPICRAEITDIREVGNEEQQ